MHTPKRNRRCSLNEQDYPNFTVSSDKKIVNETTSSWLDCGDKFRSACREFTDNTRKLCNLIVQLDTLCTDQSVFSSVLRQAEDILGAIERDAKITQKELQMLYSKRRKGNSAVEKRSKERVVTKREVNRRSFSTIKRSQEELTNDNFSMECDLSNSGLEKTDSAQEVKPESDGYKFLVHLLSDKADSLLTVKQELPDDESIFSQSTGCLGEDKKEDSMEIGEELDELINSDSNQILSIDFAMMEDQHFNEKLEESNNSPETNLAPIENDVINKEKPEADKLEICSNRSSSTVINPNIYEENCSSHGSGECIINKMFSDKLVEEIKKPPAVYCETADNNCNHIGIKKKDCSKTKTLSTNEIAEQIKLLKSIYTISDIESIYDKSDIELSESEEEYEKKTSPRKTETKPAEDNEYTIPEDLVIHPCLVKLTPEERELCDNFINKNVIINKRSRGSSSDGSDILLKPLKRKAIIFSSDSDTSTRSDNEDKLLESEEDHNSFTLSLPSVHNLENKTEEEEKIDELAILNAIIDSDCFSSDDESTENEDGNLKKKVKVKSKRIKQEVNEENEWKMDSLLTARLNETLEKVSDSEDDAITASKEDADDEKAEGTIKNESSSESEESTGIFEVSTDSSESVIEFIDLIGSLNNSEATGKTPGRRNIRALLSEDTLEQTTKQAEQAEKEHIERLKEKRKNMKKILSDLEGTGLVLDASGSTRIEVNPLLSKRLKPHQTSGVQFMWDACYETVEMINKYPGAGCILAHCMGLGKTYQVITLIHTLFKYPEATKTKYVLVVCPLSTVYNWKNEFTIALDVSTEDPIEHIHLISDEQKSRTAKLLVIKEWHKTGGVLIMCYEAFVCFSSSKVNNNSANAELTYKALINPGPDLIICDEGHQLKNAKALRSKMLMKTNTRRRIILTGTPLQNNLEEYYHMVQFVKPNLLGTFKEYMNRFVNPINNGQYDDSTGSDIQLMKMRSYVLHYLLKNTIERYEVTELQKYLPPKLDYVLFVRLHPVQVNLYKKYMQTFMPQNSLGKLFSHFTALRPTWVHPYILHLKDLLKPQTKKKPPPTDFNLEEEFEIPNEIPVGWWKELTPDDFMTNLDYGPKLKIMLSIIKECERVNDQLLIFTQFLADLDTIETFLKLSDSTWKHGVNYLRMDGTLGIEVRQKYCNKFNEIGSPIKIFLLTHKVGGLGLNFASANRVILMDVCWNPSLDTQSIFRIYRFGQIKPCYVYRLVSMGTIEEVMYERCVTKLAISGRVVDEKQISRHYKSSDLTSIYRCNLDISEDRPTPKLPADEVLARLLQIHEKEIYKYHEHQSLLENRADEVLDESEIKLAWEEFKRENEPPPPQPPPMPQIGPMQKVSMLDINKLKYLRQALISNLAAAALPNLVNQTSSHSATTRNPSIYGAQTPTTSIANNTPRNVPSTSGNYSVNVPAGYHNPADVSTTLPNQTRYINSIPSATVALPSKPGDTLKRFDLKFVQNPETGRDDIQLVNTTKSFQNNAIKQYSAKQPMPSSSTTRNYVPNTSQPIKAGIVPPVTTTVNGSHISMSTTSILKLPNPLFNGIQGIPQVQGGKTDGVIQID